MNIRTMTIRCNLFFLFMVFFAVGICGCNHYDHKKDTISAEGSTGGPGNRDDNLSLSPPVQAYRLWHTYDQFDLRSFTYYGGFFEDRLKFFFKSNPGLSIANAGVDLLILYFLDNRLVKIRYHLDQDVTDPMLDSLGLGSLETRYNTRKKVLATDKTIRRLREYNREKGRKDEFNIVWDRQIIESSYHVDPNPSSIYKFDTIKANFVYIDQLKSYRKSLIRLENELRNKLVLSAEN